MKIFGKKLGREKTYPDHIYRIAVSMWWIWQHQIAIGLDDTGRCEAGRENIFFRVSYSFVTALAEDDTTAAKIHVFKVPVDVHVSKKFFGKWKVKVW